jgi:dienelactone hydrolase
MSTVAASAQRYGEPDRASPGDAAIQDYLARRARVTDATFLEGIQSADDWQARRPEWHREYLEMLGLWPMPERTDLKATVTGTIERDGYVVEKLHFQSMPGLYVTANLYRPARAEGLNLRLPTILYVCGHANMGRNGNKTAYQTNPIWFARHGYVCLALDSLQLGEIPGVHHGTYREGRWWWVSRGYTPAGVECWNGMRAIDYLLARPDVDASRIGVTGISGGGAATFWIAAADERVAAAAPVSAMADLESYLGNLTVNGHCDCMFLHNAHRWPWTRIAGLIAPRPLLFVNSDADPIFPMDANERIIARLERLYSLFGASDRVDAVVSVGGHDYRRDIRQAVFRFFNSYFRGDPSLVADSEDDVVIGSGADARYPIDPESLRVFPTDADYPPDRINGEIDRTFVPMAETQPPRAGEFAAWRDRLMNGLRERTFLGWPERVPAAEPAGDGQILTEPGIALRLASVREPVTSEKARRVRLVLLGPRDGEIDASGAEADPSDAVYRLEPRGRGEGRWTRKNPPNYVERSLLLLGDTVDSGRVRDAAAAARWLHASEGAPVALVASGPDAVLAALAAAFEPDLAEVIAIDPPSSLMDDGAPVLLNALRVCDVPEMLGLVAPRRLTIRGGAEDLRRRVKAIYEAAGAADKLTLE